MKKNMFKRAWLNITRKKSKTIILFIIFFVIANLVLASLAITNSVEESTEYAKNTLGSEIYLSADMEKLRSEISGEMTNGSMSMDQGMDKVSMHRPDTSVDMVNDIANSEYVKDYTYSLNATYEPVNFNLIEVETSEKGVMADREIPNTVTGVNSYAFIPGVINNIFEITEGTYFDENTDNKVIISYELASENDLAVGDILEFENTESLEVFEYEIIGIFLASEEGYENDIYMNINSAENLMTEESYNEGNYSVSSIIYYLNNPEETDLFIDEASSKYDLDEMNLILDIDNTAYEQMAGPLESVGSFASTILVVVILAAVLIIALIINNNIKERKYEVGVLMSLGATKKNIVGQLLVELILIATVGFVLSMATSTLIAGGLSDSLLENQIQMSEESSENNFGRPSGGMNFGSRNSLQQSSSDVEVIDEIDVSVSISEYITLFIVGYLIVIIALSLPSINIMKYEPKTILTGRQ